MPAAERTDVEPSAVRRTFVRFALVVGAVMVLVCGVSLWLLHRAATGEALEAARTETQIVGRAVVEPLLRDQPDPAGPAVRRRLDALFARGAFGERVAHVKLWAADGRVLYASEPRLIGRRFALAAEERAALAGGGAIADVSDVSRPENRFERDDGDLLEVYTAVWAGGGQRLLFETYRPYALVTADERHLWTTFAPALIAAVLLLALLVLPLVLGLARRLERGRREREKLLRHALEASDRERTRIARELHDGPVQRLAGVAFALAGAERSGPDADVDALQETVREGAQQVRETVRELRGTLTELYPPNLHRQGLQAALADVLAPLRAAGVAAELDVPAGLGLEPEAETVLFRAAQEATRNVVEHAGAKRATLTVRCRDGVASIEMADDGRGFAPDPAVPDGHFGLRLLDDLAREHGGRLAVHSAPGAGTRLCFEVPA